MGEEGRGGGGEGVAGVCERGRYHSKCWVDDTVEERRWTAAPLLEGALEAEFERLRLCLHLLHPLLILTTSTKITVTITHTQSTDSRATEATVTRAYTPSLLLAVRGELGVGVGRRGGEEASPLG